jgi:hypothetical protein
MHLSIGCYAAVRLQPAAMILDSDQDSLLLSGKRPDSLPQRSLPQRILVWGLPANYQDLGGVAFFLHESVLPTPFELQPNPKPWDFFRDFSSLLRPECAHVRLRAQYAPIPVSLNGRPVNRPYFGFSSSYRSVGGELEVSPVAALWQYQKWFVAGQGPSLLPGGVGHSMDRMLGASTLLMRTSVDGNEPWDRTKQADRTESYAAAAWGRAARLRMWGTYTMPCELMAYYVPPSGKYIHPSEIEWVKDGVMVERVLGTTEMARGMRAVVSADGVQTDLSQFSLVRNEAYRIAMDRLVASWGVLVKNHGYPTL